MCERGLACYYLIIEFLMFFDTSKHQHHHEHTTNQEATNERLTLAWGAKAAAEPTRAKARASFMVDIVLRRGVDNEKIMTELWRHGRSKIEAQKSQDLQRTSATQRRQ